MRQKMFRRARRLLSAAVLLAGSAFATMAPAAEYRFYSGNPVENGAVRGMKSAIERIEKETGGAVSLKLYMGGTLQIQTSDITQAVSDGIIPIGEDQSFTGTIPVGGILRLPGLLRNVQEYDKAHEIIRPYLESAYERYGIKVLADFRYPPVVIWGRDSIASLADIKGKKFRVASEDTGAFIELFGGMPITIQFAELATALDRGMVDGLTTAAGGAGWAMRDYLKSSLQLPLNYSNTYIIASNDALAEMGPENAEKVRAIFAEELARASDDTAKEEAVSLQKMVDAGLVATVATAEEIAEMEKAMAQYWDVWAAKRGPETVEALGKVRAAVGR